MKPITDVVEHGNLGNLHCDVCFNYLSALPVSINTQTGENICGRCMSYGTTRNSIFEILVKQFLLPCAYTVEGCLTAQTIEDIGKHEKICTYRTFKCYCHWTENTYGFIKHFEDQHQECVVGNGGTFSITDRTYTHLLFKNQGLYFYIKCLYRDNILCIRIAGVTNASQTYKGTFKCNQIGTNVSIETAVETIAEFHCTKGLPTFSFQLELPDDFVANIFKSIICPNCSIQMTPPILRCPSGHISCLQCSTEWLDYCKMCDEECEYTCDSELQCVALCAEFSCRWNCGNLFKCTDIREHEQGCEKRIYSCFHSVDCDWSGYLEDLVIHDKTCVSTVYGAEEQCLFCLNYPEVTFLGTLTNRTISHLIVYKCCFNVIYDVSNGVTCLYINHYDIYGFSWFCFEAELTHTDESNVLFNKIYIMKHTRGGIYKAVVPQADIIKFGGGQFYKITVRVVLFTEQERSLCADSFYEHFKNYKKENDKFLTMDSI